MRPTQEELFEFVQNVIGIFDTPAARQQIRGNMANELRKQARDIYSRMKSYSDLKERYIIRNQNGNYLCDDDGRWYFEHERILATEFRYEDIQPYISAHLPKNDSYEIIKVITKR